MWRLYRDVIIRLSPKVASILPFSMYGTDNDIPYPKSVEPPDPNETGFDRVKKIFKVDEHGVMSEDAVLSLQATYTGIFIGVMYGGIYGGKKAYDHFMANNEATIFKNHFEAKRMLQDRVSIAFGYGGVRWGWRIGFFTGSIALVSSCVCAYRGKNSFVDYAVGGMMAGVFYKLSHGLVPSIVGGVLGGIMGAIGGMLIMLALQLSGVSYQDIKKAAMKLAVSRKELDERIAESCTVEKEKVLTGAHEELIGVNKDLTMLNEPAHSEDVSQSSKVIAQ